MNAVTDVLNSVRLRIDKDTAPNRYLEALEEGRLPRKRLHWLAGELFHLVGSDRRSFALLASRFPAPPTGDLYLAMAQGEGEALALLGDFAAAIGMTEPDLRAYEPQPLTQAYPAYLVRSALYGASCDIALALLANVKKSAETYSRVADALVSRYDFEERALSHFRYFADTPPSLLEQATAALSAGLAAGDDPRTAIRCAQTVHALENAFWNCLADGLEPD